MRKNLFATVLMLTMTMAMIAAMGISNVSAQPPPPYPEIVVTPQLATGTSPGNVIYKFNIRNAPHTNGDTDPLDVDRTWNWQVKLTWDPTVLGNPIVVEDTYTPGSPTGTYGFLGYFEVWYEDPFMGWMKKPYVRSGLSTSFAPGSAIIADALKDKTEDPTLWPIYAGDPRKLEHLGTNYDLPYSEGLTGHGYPDNELNLFWIRFDILKDGPPYSTPITVELGVDTFFMCHDATTEYHVSLPQAWFGEIGLHLHSLGSPIPNPSNPVGTSWHELYPNYCYEYDLIQFRDDNGDGVLSYCDEILLHPTEPAGADLWYHVEEVTTTITVSLKPALVDTMYIDLELPADVLPDEVYTPIKEPICTQWHELYPDYCKRYHLTDWEDTGPDNPGELGVSDQIQLTDKETGEAAWYHVDDVCTDIIVTPEPDKPVPEFPLGIGITMMMALVIPIVYLWRTRKKEK